MSEARNPGIDFFPLPETMESISFSTAPQEFLEQLHQALIRHIEGHLADDVAMILVDQLDEGAGTPLKPRSAIGQRVDTHGSAPEIKYDLFRLSPSIRMTSSPRVRSSGWRRGVEGR